MMSSHQKQRGLTLIELMIAIVIGLFLTAGLIELFTNSKQTYRVQENLSRLQENARFAMQILAKDIRMADYAGCNNSSLSEATDNINNANANYDAALHNFTAAIGGLNGAADAGGNIALDQPDTITIVNAIDSGVVVQPVAGALASSAVGITAGHGFEQGDIVLIADCQRADIVQINNADVGATNLIQHVTGGFSHTVDGNTVEEPGNFNPLPCAAGGTAHCLSAVYDGNASVYLLNSNTYIIQNNPNGVRALYRNGQELVEGIENMQILYGEDTDTDNDNTPNYYVPAGIAGLDWENVVSVRVSLLASTLEDNVATQPVNYTIFGSQVAPADNRIRRVFTSTIALRNRLP